MKVKKIDIKNFKGIRKIQIDFHPRLNVFAGKNGSGKTTILNALGKQHKEGRYGTNSRN
ncbi:AAA family ATPase [Desulfobacterales bacterium HSG17]|nr:AAA family ATPase [Desulfobacterales bacterium HSG17]